MTSWKKIRKQIFKGKVVQLSPQQLQEFVWENDEPGNYWGRTWLYWSEFRVDSDTGQTDKFQEWHETANSWDLGQKIDDIISRRSVYPRFYMWMNEYDEYCVSLEFVQYFSSYKQSLFTEKLLMMPAGINVISR